MRRTLTVLLLAVLAVALFAGCSSPNQPGRYVPMREHGNWILDTQTGAIYAPDDAVYDGWRTIRGAIPEDRKRNAEGKGPSLWDRFTSIFEPPPPMPPPPAAAPADR